LYVEETVKLSRVRLRTVAPASRENNPQIDPGQVNDTFEMVLLLPFRSPEKYVEPFANGVIDTPVQSMFEVRMYDFERFETESSIAVRSEHVAIWKGLPEVPEPPANANTLLGTNIETMTAVTTIGT
jgi:hypothetical protein